MERYSQTCEKRVIEGEGGGEEVDDAVRSGLYLYGDA